MCVVVEGAITLLERDSGQPGVLATFRGPASQANEHSSFVTSPCVAPLALLTLDDGAS